MLPAVNTTFKGASNCPQAYVLDDVVVPGCSKSHLPVSVLKPALSLFQAALPDRDSCPADRLSGPSYSPQFPLQGKLSAKQLPFNQSLPSKVIMRGFSPKRAQVKLKMARLSKNSRWCVSEFLKTDVQNPSQWQALQRS